jgi:hypothetical protein
VVRHERASSHTTTFCSPTSQESSSQRPPAPPTFNASTSSHESPSAQPTLPQSLHELTAGRPNLLTFCCPWYLSATNQWESWDDTDLFYDDQLAEEDNISRQCQESLLRIPDLSKKTARFLQQNFVDFFLRWFPICDLQDCAAHVNRANACQFDPANPSSCFTMFLLAIGSIAGRGTESVADNLPGVDYLARGNMMLETMSFKTTCLVAKQCRFLQAAYFELSLHPLQGWSSINHASRDCMNLLSSSIPRNLDARQRDALQRLFWACSIVIQ